MDKQQASEILQRLTQLYPDAKPALTYKTPFELLVAVILSAQCTDKRVNVVTDELFKKHRTPEDFASMEQADLEKAIYTCGFYHNKAQHIIEASKAIVEKFGGNVPDNLADLQTLPGVGRKTANVVYSVAFHGDAIAVDTHVFRVSNRLGLAEAKDVLNTEKQLNDVIEKDMWSRAHHLLIYHGRNVCHSQRPACGTCTLRDLCRYGEEHQ